MAFHRLSHLTKRAVYTYVRETARSISKTVNIFFLNFIVIPGVECIRENIQLYRENNLLALLEFFVPRVRGLDFNNEEDIRFFREIEDLLFADAKSYQGLDKVVSFNERCFLFDAFFTGPHLQEKTHRNDLFYLYYMIYSLCEHQRPQITAQLLRDLVQSFRTLNYRRATDQGFSRDGLENILCKSVNIYSRCNTSNLYFRLDITDLELFIHFLYDRQLLEDEIEIISDVLSVLPRGFNAPVHITANHIITLLPRIQAVQENFRYITNLFSERLRLSPQTPHLEILTSMFPLILPQIQ